MFKVIDLPPEGKPEQTVGPDRVRPPPEGTFRWVDLVDAGPDDLALLGERFRFHPLALEDCRSFEPHAKVDEYPDFLFIVFHTFTLESADPIEVRIHEYHAFLTEDTLVTVHDATIPAHEQAWQRALDGRDVLGRGPCWALYTTADALIDAIFPLLETITDQLEDIEEALLLRAEKADLVRIFKTRRTLFTMQRVIWPLRDAVSILSRRGPDPRVRRRTAEYFRDAHDHVLRCAEMIEESLALAGNAMEAYRSFVSNKTNEVMKKLTVMSVIFLPLAVITGFWGQNFRALPFDSVAYMYGMLAMMVLVPVALYLWFRRKGLW